MSPQRIGVNTPRAYALSDEYANGLTTYNLDFLNNSYIKTS